MLRTIIILIACLLIIPVVAFRFDAPLEETQWEALITMIQLMLGVGVSCFIVSEITRNCSQVDKLWSIIPIVYVWYFAAQAQFNDRMVLMAILVTLWGARLTFNFMRRDGYSWIPWKGEEDYRWNVLRKTPLLSSRWAWAAFNLFFISLYQNSLILSFTLPIVVAWQGADTPINAIDIVASILLLTCLVIETVADQQQYDYQTEKYRLKNNNEPLTGIYAKGFTHTGLWAKVRHPNYAAEQAIWVCFYLFSVAATGRWLNWSLTGAILLMLLFLGSSDFSEKISAEKYPDYQDYQKKVPRFLPFKWLA
ncbi:MAG: DUF1295 domain-containing protein [Bacteroidia bacterium]